MATLKQRFCGYCNGPLYLLGKLGTLLHFRCRDCGLQYSKRTRPPKPLWK